MNAIDEALAVAQMRADLRSGRARAIRERARLSQADVARALGTDAPTVSRWESGQCPPRRKYALALAQLLWELDQLGRSDTEAVP
jgi:transcriptional regulator with XRE-family HTH domain